MGVLAGLCLRLLEIMPVRLAILGAQGATEGPPPCRRGAPAWRHAALLSAALLCGAAAVRAESFNVYATDLPPLVAPGERQPQGLYVELVQLLARATGHQFIWVIQPWARAQLSAQNDPKGLIVNLTRNPEREPRYRWIAPIGWGQYAVFVLAAHPATSAIELAEQRIGYLNGADAAAILNEAGLRVHEPAATGVSNARKLRAGHIQGWAANVWTGPSTYEQAGFDARELRALPFGKPWHQWLAGSSQLAEGVAVELGAAMRRLKDDGSFRALELRYLPPAARAMAAEVEKRLPD